MKKTGLILLSALLMCGMHASAEHSIREDQANGSIVISGAMSKEVHLKEVSVNILKPGKSLEDLKKAAESGIPEDLTEVLEYSRQLPANSDGSFEVSVKINGTSGIYTVFVDYEGNQASDAEFVSFVRQEDRIAAVSALLKASNAQEMETILTQQQFVLNFDTTLFQELDAKKTAEKLYALLKETPISSDSIDDEKIKELETAFLQACALEGIQEGKTTISDQLTLLKMDSETEKYLTSENVKMIADVGVRMKKEVYQNLSEFQSALIQSVVLSVVRYPDGSGEIKNVIKTYAEQIGIQNPSEESSVYSRLAGKDLKDYSELRTAYQTACATKDNTGGIGGRGGGGSSSKNTGASIAIPGIAADPAPTETSKEIFEDLENVSWARDAIMRLYEKKIIAGKEETLFAPNDSLTREEFTAMLVRAFDLQKKDEIVVFDDVAESAWYYEAVITAVQNGIAKGTGDGFGIGQALTRQDMAVMLYRAAEISEIKLSDSAEELDFLDRDEISDYAKEAVRVLKNAGIINGMGNSCFEPRGINTRAQAAVVIDLVLRRAEV